MLRYLFGPRSPRKMWRVPKNFIFIPSLMLLGMGRILQGITGQSMDSGGCLCNPEDNNTGPVCANNGVTFGSACDFRLRQGLKADLGIRCVGECPCDDSMLGVGIDCRSSVSSTTSTPGLEFCGTNAVTYNSENMFMCDQVQDPSLAIACPGPCPCQLADCSPLFPPAPTNASPPARSSKLPTLPSIINHNQPVASSVPFHNLVRDTMTQHVQHKTPLDRQVAPTWQPPTPTPSFDALMLQNVARNDSSISSIHPTMWPPQLSAFVSDFPSPPMMNNVNAIPNSKTIKAMQFNPLAEALRTVPFRLFRHLYIAISVAAEGMKSVPMQIAKNMQTRLPSYAREIPAQMAMAVQEALEIHLDSLMRQVKDTVDTVRAILDQDSMK